MLSSRKWLVATASALTVLFAAACSSGPTTASSGGDGTKEIVLGLQTATTGPAASSYGEGTIEAARARIEKANATNEVPGVKFRLETADEGGTPAGALTATQGLVERKKASAILAAGPYFFGAYRYTVQKGVPVFGIGTDGPQWADPANKNLFAYSGSVDQSYPAYSGLGEHFKSKGVTKLCMVSHEKASSSKPGRAMIASMDRAGIQTVYQNFNIPLGGTDFNAAALAVRDSGCDGVVTIVAMSSNISFFQSLKNIGIDGSHFKASMTVGMYGQELLDDPVARAAAQGYGTSSVFEPASLNTEATKAMAAALKQYAGWDKPYPKSAHTWGWFTADLAVEAFKRAGKDATSEQIIDTMSKVTDYDANGLICPVDFSKHSAYIQPFVGNCLWIATVKGDGYESTTDPIKLAIIPGTGQAQ